MSDITPKKRETNLDVIRCIALFCVLAIHFCTHSGIYGAGYTGLAAFAADALRLAYMPAVSLFVMLTGYFQYKKTASRGYYMGVLKLFEMYFLCSIVNILYVRFYLGQPMGLREMFSGIVNYNAIEYSWYILMYNGLFLLLPFLNLSYNNISCRGHKRILIISLFVISALPFSFLNAFVNLNSFWWQRIWPLMFYFIGAYFAEYRPKVSAKKSGLVFLAFLLGFSVYNFFLYDLSSPLVGLARTDYRYSYESLQNAVLTPLLFLWIMNIDMSALPEKLARLAATVSRYTYGAFLFSSITDSFVYLWLNRFVPNVGLRYLFFPISLPISYAAAVLLSYLGDKLVNCVDKLIRPPLTACVDWLYSKTAPDAPDAK